MKEKYQTVADNIAEAFHKYKAYYDRKAQAQPLKVGDYAFLLNPKYKDQSQKAQFKTFHWNGPYKVAKVLTNYNYIIRQVETNLTQCVNRIRLRKYTPNGEINDIEVQEKDYEAHSEAISDADTLDDHIPENAQRAISEEIPQEEPT